MTASMVHVVTNLTPWSDDRKSGRLKPYKAKSGKEVGMVKNGRVGAAAMIQGAERANEFQTWMLRGGAVHHVDSP
jgi:hypothetical protein